LNIWNAITRHGREVQKKLLSILKTRLALCSMGAAGDRAQKRAKQKAKVYKLRKRLDSDNNVTPDVVLVSTGPQAVPRQLRP